MERHIKRFELELRRAGDAGYLYGRYYRIVRLLNTKIYSKKQPRKRLFYLCVFCADLAEIGGAKLQKIKKSLRLAFSFWFGEQ